MKKIKIHPDIREAHTLSAAFYRETYWLEEVRERVFLSSLQYAGHRSDLPQANSWVPLKFVPDLLPEPLLLTRDHAGQYHCLSNVCTHRGNLLAYTPGNGKRISCRYHGRCFRIDGQFQSMPGFEETANFPSEKDHLPRLPLFEWKGLFFTGLQPKTAFADWIQPVEDRLHWLPLEQLEPHSEGNTEYPVAANWALYCDNFLEGFHIPFVHPALQQAIGGEPYETILFPHGSLQIGIAREGEPHFELPPHSPDAGKRIYAYYFWLYPNLMLNFYPWGLSLNQVLPVSPSQSRIRYRTFVFPGKEHLRTVNAIDQTEMEDQEIVEQTQRGMESRLFDQGRYSPTHERGVHHFHRLLAADLNQEPGVR